MTVAYPPELPPEACPLVDYLRARVREERECYLKSRYIADDIGLSAKQIGAFMKRLAESEMGPTVERWSYTNGTTWRVTD